MFNFPVIGLFFLSFFILLWLILLSEVINNENVIHQIATTKNITKPPLAVSFCPDQMLMSEEMTVLY